MNTQISLMGKQFNLASRLRRRWIVVTVYAALSVWMASWWAYPRTLVIVATMVFLGSLLAMTALVGSGAEEGDERQVYRRDHAFYMAYRLLGWMLILVLFTASFRGTISSALAGPALAAVLEKVGWVVFFAFVALYGTLPQAILLWTEPDIEDAR
jgi:hypothetical protein